MNQDNKIVGIGYNGMPNGCDDDFLPWARTADNNLDTKYLYGELNLDFMGSNVHLLFFMTYTHNILIPELNGN